MGRRTYGTLGLTIGLVLGLAGAAVAKKPFQEVVVKALEGIVQVEGTVAVEEPVSVTGDVGVTGTVSVDEPVEVTGTVDVGSMEVAGDVAVRPDVAIGLAISRLAFLDMSSSGFSGESEDLGGDHVITSVSAYVQKDEGTIVNVNVFRDGEVVLQVAFDQSDTIAFPFPVVADEVSIFCAEGLCNDGGTIGDSASISGYPVP